MRGRRIAAGALATLGLLALSALAVAVGWYTGASPSAERARAAVAAAVASLRARFARPALDEPAG